MLGYFGAIECLVGRVDCQNLESEGDADLILWLFFQTMFLCIANLLIIYSLWGRYKKANSNKGILLLCSLQISTWDIIIKHIKNNSVAQKNKHLITITF